MSLYRTHLIKPSLPRPLSQLRTRYVANPGQACENKLIFKAFLATKRPLSKLQLSQITGLKTAAINCAMYHLIRRLKIVKKVHLAPCEDTGKSAWFYFFVETLI
jgi:hypothetical protein